MPLGPTEIESGGFARDADHRLLVVPQQEGGGPLSISAVVGISVVNAISTANYNLNSSSYSASSSVTQDFVLNRIEFKFSTPNTSWSSGCSSRSRSRTTT